ncbi:porin [Hansschlegelia plantiphila]|uniref:Porin n=1 Tax=Hansschlegelia plantiphila TaxID=374655 RepID=A0A9W6MUW1_9HYPH|nr:porin [Hansschlegelia plantiphila]
MGAMVALLAGGAASAADLPAYEPAPAASVPSFSWTGAYAGVQAGYDWFDADNKVNGFSPQSKPDGFTVGGYVGYNQQLNGSPLVLGIETDLNYSGADSSRRFGAGSGVRNKIDFTGAVRGRIGYAFDRFLIYGAGGLAYADHDVKGRGGGSDDTIAVGWTIGGGVEAALGDNVSARVEYRYSDFGTDSFSVAGSRVKSDVTDNRVLLGVGYKFSSGW